MSPNAPSSPNHISRRSGSGLRWLLLLCVMWQSGCGWVQGRITGGIMADLATATARHDDVDLVRDAIPPFLLLLDGLIEGSGEDVSLLSRGAESYIAYASLIEVSEPARAARLYGRAQSYGRRALIARRPQAAALLEQPFDQFTQIEALLDEDDIQVVFWAASSWGAWVSTNLESMAALAQLPRVIFLMEWVLARDEGFYDGAPHIFLGVYHAALPPMLGGSPDRALLHFERALEINERQSLMVQVQMARYYARQIFDRELFVQLLEEVLNTPADTNPDLTLQNMAAQQQARVLLEQTDELF